MGGKISAGEDAQARNCEANLGTSEQPLLVGMPEKGSRRMAITATAERHEVFAALDRSFPRREAR